MNATSSSVPEPGSVAWLDRLVELHVLAEHGDPDAVSTARAWIAADGEARRVWEQVQRTCDDLSAVPDGAGAAREGRP